MSCNELSLMAAVHLSTYPQRCEIAHKVERRCGYVGKCAGAITDSFLPRFWTYKMHVIHLHILVFMPQISDFFV